MLLLTCLEEYLTLLIGHILLWRDCKKHSLWNLTCIFLILILIFVFMILGWLRVVDEGLKITLEVSIKRCFRLSLGCSINLSFPGAGSAMLSISPAVLHSSKLIIANHIFPKQARHTFLAVQTVRSALLIASNDNIHFRL